jgi:hypothetical protein
MDEHFDEYVQSTQLLHQAKTMHCADLLQSDTEAFQSVHLQNIRALKIPRCAIFKMVLE